jgi:HAE1 family hydrophobic/amphiphilic exporter-1
VIIAIPRAIVWGLTWVGARLSPWVNRALVPFDTGYQWIENTYPIVARKALERPVPVLAGSAALLLVSLVMGATLPLDLFPSSRQGEFSANVTLPEGSALEVTDETLRHIASTVGKSKDVSFVHTSAGQTDLSAFEGGAREPNRGQIAVRMKRTGDIPAEERAEDALRAALEQVPGLTYELEKPAILSFKAPIEIEVYAYDLDTLRSVARAVAGRIDDVPGLEDVQTSIRAGDPEVQVTFDRARLASMQLDPLSASRLVRNAVQGEAATQFNDLERKLDVRVRASENERSMVSELAQLEVGRSEGRSVPLAAVADVRVARGSGDIRRIGQQRAAVVTANLAGRDLGSAAKDIQAALASVPRSSGTTVVLAGQNRELSESFSSLRFAILLAVFLVYLVMASQFESLLHPFVIMFSMPMALIGVVFTMFATGTSISVMVLIGLVVLAGIVVNNAIVLIDYANQLRHAGRSKHDALIEAGLVRLRPILMTTLTTVLGLVPMAIGLGGGAELRAPLALTLIGGLTLATVLTLVVLPVVYATLDRS